MVELPSPEYRALVEAIAARVAVPAAVLASPALAAAIEHTQLAPDATAVQIEQLCEEAERWGVAAVCVHPCWVARAVARLRSSPVAVVTVVGFPLGAGLGSVLRHEAAECLKLGADELDVVLNLGALKSGDGARVAGDLRGIAELAHAAGARVKAILETARLDRQEKIRACQLALEAGADFVKTSTGFGPAGATVEDVALLRATVGGRAGVKASGGIRTRAQAEALLAAGANRLGTTATAALLATGNG